MATRLDDCIDSNKECLSKLSYNYKRSLDKELVYNEVNKESDDEDDMKNDEIPEVDVKTEGDAFSDLPCAENENIIKEESKNNENDMKQEFKIKDGGENGCYTVAIAKDETTECIPRRRMLKRNVNVTAKRKTSAKATKNNLKRVKQLEENNKVTKQVTKSPAAPKPRCPRKVQSRQKAEPTYPCTECGQIFA
ncbi:jg10516 [Pararge aegeria aegeria]|uniref:Jg10516 protein n=1 Tax=Pararge aegeria aegeria TaxID=348720 RepID=A0A8S4QXN2_9NEOP|nr:jg10516 [Pararge aegeria aegeria]